MYGFAVSSAFTMTLLLASTTFAYVFYKVSKLELMSNTISAVEKWEPHRFPKRFGYYLFLLAYLLFLLILAMV
jgi:hypothetical protein